MTSFVKDFSEALKRESLDKHLVNFLEFRKDFPAIKKNPFVKGIVSKIFGRVSRRVFLRVSLLPGRNIQELLVKTKRNQEISEIWQEVSIILGHFLQHFNQTLHSIFTYNMPERLAQICSFTTNIYTNSDENFSHETVQKGDSFSSFIFFSRYLDPLPLFLYLIRILSCFSRYPPPNVGCNL